MISLLNLISVYTNDISSTLLTLSMRYLYVGISCHDQLA